MGDSSLMMNFEEVGQWMINRGREQVRPGEMASKASPRPNSGEIFDNIQRLSQIFSGRITDVFFVISFHSFIFQASAAVSHKISLIKRHCPIKVRK